MDPNSESETFGPLARAIGNYILPQILEHISALMPVAEERPKTQKEACVYLSCTRQTLNNYEKSGDLTPIRKTAGGKPLYPLAELKKISLTIKKRMK